MADAAKNQSIETDASIFGEMLPVDPFRALFVHFGMLLGVEDFNTLDAYHRGKAWFHSAWLHREGTIWGLRVGIDTDNREVRVARGAATDGLGRELYLSQDACLDLGAWFDANRESPALQEVSITDETSGEVTFDAHVVIRHRACLNRQVPALTEPCDGSQATTAYSRVVETVELLMQPGLAPDWRNPAGSLPYHRVRLLLGLEAPIEDEGIVIESDQEVLDARADILSRPAEEQAVRTLDWFRYFSSLDQMALEPAAVADGEVVSLFPGEHPAPVPLANLVQVSLMPADSGWTVSDGVVDNSIRPVHLPTTTTQELVCGAIGGGVPAAGAAPPEAPAAPVPDAGGTRIDGDSVRIRGETIRFSLVGPPLMAASVEARGIQVLAFDERDGWVTAEIRDVIYDQSAATVEIHLRDAPGGNLVRLIVKGTGDYPLLSSGRIPLAGAVGGEPGTKNQGNDFISMLRVRS